MSEIATLLLVENDEIDLEATKRALEEKKMLNPVLVTHDGIEALEILRGEDGQEKIQHPIVVLLDINMPRMNGLEFLDEIRADDNLKRLVIFVMTTSCSDEDITHAYNNIAGYSIKSKDGGMHTKVIEFIDNYWQFIKLPKD